jgi:hypothetical protein
MYSGGKFQLLKIFQLRPMSLKKLFDREIL